MKKNQMGFSAIHVLLVVVVLGIASFAGWRVYESQKAAERSSSNTINASEESKPTTANKEPTNKIPDGYREYVNDELGFSFAYPKAWGEVKTAYVTGGDATDHFSLVFSNSSYDPEHPELSSDLTLNGIIGYNYRTDGWYKLLAAGFEKKNDTYYDRVAYKDIPEAEREIKDPIKIIGKHNDGIVITRDQLPSGYKAKVHYAGFNLMPNKRQIDGVRFMLVEQENPLVNMDDFYEMLSTFEVL